MEEKYKELIYRDKSQVPEHLLKYYYQRNRLFSQYDQGVILDEESWYSVTPELIAMQTAERCRCGTIVDAFCGVGGNAISFAFTCERVIAIDIDPVKIELAKHNAEIYGVADRIEFVQQDFLTWAKESSADYKIDVIFFSPPWGGINYMDTFTLDSLKPVTGAELVRVGKTLTPYICMFLPRNTTLQDISQLDDRVEIEENWMSGKFKAITVYLGDFSKECLHLKQNPPDNIRVALNDADVLDVVGYVQGPEGTPYQDGFFKIKFNFGADFPTSPPTCRMLTKIFHPNISKTGEICVSTLKKDWRPEYGIEHILITIKCLLIYPGPDSALDEEAGKLLQESYQDYFNHAQMITAIHAKHRPIEFDSSPSQIENQPLSHAPLDPSTKSEQPPQKQPLKSKEANAKKKGLKRL
ncbi:hypothetical protein E3P99_01543 [Wallemia hederae]|uniref:Trimethylguanosine synthase n=1 Tax=Wallemia hederae TaxID=1540922 RepID=A0A4V4LTR6_9BASI|nr:hypothetical protein E3P99_01543 [Wallemia hederae]